MKGTLNSPPTGTGPGQVDTARRGLAASFPILVGSFVFLVILTFGLYAFTTDGRKSLLQFFTFLFTGENAVRLLAHISGILATMVLIVLFAVLSTLLYLRIRRPARYDKVLAALRSTLRGDQRDKDPAVRSEAAKGLAKLDVEESAVYEQHEELDDILVATLQGEQRDESPLVRYEAAKGLSELELEQHSYLHKHHKLDDMIFKANP